MVNFQKINQHPTWLLVGLNCGLTLLISLPKMYYVKLLFIRILLYLVAVLLGFFLMLSMLFFFPKYRKA